MTRQATLRPRIEHMPAAAVPVQLSWKLRAWCLGTDPEVFFPVSEAAKEAFPAKQICALCPVIDDCREECDRLEDDAGRIYGIYAGETPKERLARRRGEQKIIRHERRPPMRARGFAYNTVQVAQLTGVTQRQLKYWAEIGVARPSIQDSGGRAGRWRLYSAADVELIREVLAWVRQHRWVRDFPGRAA